MTDSRYPYTHACDYIRGLSPIQYGEGIMLSRSAVSQIIKGIAQAIGMDDHQLACKLADAFLEQQNDPEYQKQQEKRYLIAMGIQST